MNEFPGRTAPFLGLNASHLSRAPGHCTYVYEVVIARAVGGSLLLGRAHPPLASSPRTHGLFVLFFKKLPVLPPVINAVRLLGY